MKAHFEITQLNPAVTAADHVVAALGQEAARLAMISLRADWLTPTEAYDLEPLAVGIAYLLEEECPPHRNEPANITVAPLTQKEVADHIAARVREHTLDKERA